MLTLFELALAYTKAGFSIIPISPDGTTGPTGSGVTPFDCSEYISRRIARPDELRAWFLDDGQLSLAVALGQISGGLECLDLTFAAGAKLFWQLVTFQCGTTLLDRLPTVKSTIEGRTRLYYRCPKPARGYQQLAQLVSDKVQDRIEACLDALLAQRDLSGRPLPPDALGLVLLLNNCSDRTAAIARGVKDELGPLFNTQPKPEVGPLSGADSSPKIEWVRMKLKFCLVDEAQASTVEFRPIRSNTKESRGSRTQRFPWLLIADFYSHRPFTLCRRKNCEEIQHFSTRIISAVDDAGREIDGITRPHDTSLAFHPLLSGAG
jgi:hypothetical protein